VVLATAGQRSGFRGGSACSRGGAPAAEIGYGVAFTLGGALSGAAFPAISRLVEAPELGAGRIGALVESADHWGAALGALLAGTLMVPVLGVADSARLLAAALVCAMLTVVLGRGTTLARLARGLRRLRLVRAPAAFDGA